MQGKYAESVVGSVLPRIQELEDKVKELEKMLREK